MLACCDQTKHMLWHFQNGGLAGMKGNNPKVVLVMIGTNNRGIPELHGYDTAYGILVVLKEIHAQLPKSKILLMPIFPVHISLPPSYPKADHENPRPREISRASAA